MGQKVSPVGLRLGINRTWDSRWYAGKDYAKTLFQDVKLRDMLSKKLKLAGISRIIIERAAKKMVVTLHAGRPGLIIGKKGADIEKLRSEIAAFTGSEVALNIIEIRKPEVDGKLVAEGVTSQLERRVSFRRAMKRATQSALRLGAQGIRINVSGRLGGTDIARMEWYREGRVPLHTLRANIDYATAEALTTFGIIGCKVWIYKGDIMGHDPMAQDKLAGEQQQGSGPRERNDRSERA
jgi:small subunit ribosomal protein S3